ncbi:tRNA (adenosine(37)-N6)-threonylcarbamoyltransferase complex ATPase subunit type 1 TsaE [Candidatus Falkowbacteria bacterium RIFOXYC2_FULL_47_12]|uniref:tRNA threonylcarbamoyladenosine biosynthesis protein TsaE n=2 Tax=Candidatus Falkowiibacteriota TaxID=1752728 RepID=A0A1F5TN56_9BACT|nr:MAG: tRNA (adenosine(37)-N6)-threonylcarbamoyltransferase complex ATPase subunit type 1 TsaE [Candidatus Falkowbacteria bacterium RIFOXYA2_FULL_47_9]OGF40264.1 MAG: tRNA (adenosine(37)-N6)-threonylcarbamoyltransferase complex ATPase subunit type 1 TsaE [Candidatus Falkowbacteria bacterium RIFOXYC2_FULL_47_12]
MKSEYKMTTLQDTQRLAEQLAKKLQGGDVIGLIGNLGAGKTTFVQFLAHTLGIKQTVNSPTFNIIKVYAIKNHKSKIKNLIHIDAYRLHSAAELQALGVEEYFVDPHVVTVIEWADRVKKILPKDAMMIKIKLKKNGERIFSATSTALSQPRAFFPLPQSSHGTCLQ